jgi:hypothetical protein
MREEDMSAALVVVISSDLARLIEDRHKVTIKVAGKKVRHEEELQDGQWGGDLGEARHDYKASNSSGGRRMKPAPPFESILDHEAGKLSKDNKIGMILLNRLMAMDLREKDRVFVTSLMRQVLAERPGFGMTEKQGKWLHDICRRMGLRKEEP